MTAPPAGLRLTNDPSRSTVEPGNGGYLGDVGFQLAEVAVPRALFAAILRRIDRLRGPPVAAA